MNATEFRWAMKHFAPNLSAALGIGGEMDWYEWCDEAGVSPDSPLEYVIAKLPEHEDEIREAWEKADQQP